jgi:siroheme synthase (precorrin-2 oxidase/ferrochelatase)
MKEDVKYLGDWLKKVEDLARNIQAQAKKENKLAIFTISSTVKGQDVSRPFLTPMRRITHGFIGGSVVFSQTQAILLSKHIDGLVDQVLIDAEKKLGISLGVDEDALNHFDLELPPEKGNSRIHVEMGNLSAACAPYIQKSQFQEYKPNDITVESVWHLLSKKFRVLSGKKIAIIGGGNIGFKLALKLVESGSHVELVRRDLWRGMHMADTINIVKPKSTVAIAHYNADALQASLFCDALIGCSDGSPVITWEMIQTMKPNGVVVDVGKGSVCSHAVQQAIKEGVFIMRCDITSAIDGLISTIQRNEILIEKEMGRREVENGIFVVSGGYMGLSDDIVVDNYRDPCWVIGIASGTGDLKMHLSERDHERISIIQEKVIQARA